MEIDEFILRIHNYYDPKFDSSLDSNPPPLNFNELVLHIETCRARRRIQWIKECELKRARARYKCEINNHKTKRSHINMINKESDFSPGNVSKEPHEHIYQLNEESEETLDDLERISHYKDSIIQDFSSIKEDDEVPTITWPLYLSNLEFIEEKRNEDLLRVEKQNLKDETNDCMNFEDLEIVEPKSEHLIEEIINFTPCQQFFWEDDGDPLFDTSSMESDFNLQFPELYFHNDMEKKEFHDKVLSMEVSTMTWSFEFSNF